MQSQISILQRMKSKEQNSSNSWVSLIIEKYLIWQLCTLNSRENSKDTLDYFLVEIGEKLGNVWGMFGQYPTILVRKASTENAELAYKVQMQVNILNNRIQISRYLTIFVLLESYRY